MSLTAQVREELAHAPTGDGCCRLAEAAALLRLGGALHLDGRRGRGWSHVVTTDTGAVARRLHAALVALFDLRPEIEVHQPQTLRAAVTYVLRLADASGAPRLVTALQRLGVIDGAQRPVDATPQALTRRACDAMAYVRGALMVAASVSDPRVPPHLEVRTPGEASARGVAALLARCGAPMASPSPRVDGWRVVVKSGSAIGALLARAGAHSAFLAFDQGRLRAELRGQANRVANADRANLSRVVAASSRQVEVIQQALGSLDWDAVPDQLREVALARLANPEATLAELGAMLDPPVGKATVHRRLERLTRIAASAP